MTQDDQQRSGCYGRKEGEMNESPRREINLETVLRNLYSSEINCGIQSFWDGRWSAWLGDPMNGILVEKRFLELDEVAGWLDEMARKHYPNSVYAARNRDV